MGIARGLVSVATPADHRSEFFCDSAGEIF